MGGRSGMRGGGGGGGSSGDGGGSSGDGGGSSGDGAQRAGGGSWPLPPALLPAGLLLTPFLLFLPPGQVGAIPDMFGCSVPEPVCPNENITFWLYTREEEEPQLLDLENNDTIKSAHFASGTFKILIHGYTGHKDFSPNPEIRPEYLKRGDVNVISVDWEPLAREPCYMHAAYTVATVGNCTAQMLDALLAAGVAALPDIHVIGFSLGGQAASQVGLFLRSGTLPRVTGLDPALPLFASPHKSSKLDESDAEFVDVIHTNAGHKGKYEPCGDVDFYVNDGFTQPGCASDPDGEPSCSHARAPAYFGESINSEVGFYARACCSTFMKMIGWCEETDETVIMGEYTPSSARGTYYVHTNDRPPYALGKNDTC